MIESIAAQKEKTGGSLMLDLGGPVFVLLLFLFLFVRPLVLLGDGGTCRHYLTGLYILQNHALPQTNYMAAIESTAPWITHELLCDLIFGLPFSALGLPWVVLTSSLALALAFAWSYQFGRKRGAGVVASWVLLLLAFEASTIHWSARPHLFSYLLFLITYWQCFISESKLKSKCVWLAFVFLAWANLHGSFPLGLMMVGFRGLGDFFESCFAKAEDKTKAMESRNELIVSANNAAELKADSSLSQNLRSMWTLQESVTLFFVSLLACCINVRGASFVSYVFDYLTSPKIQFHSDEWRSLDFAFALPAWSFLGLCFAVLLFWVYCRLKPRAGEFLFVAAMACCSIYAMRLVPYFALLVLPAVAPQIGALRKSLVCKKMPLLGSLIAVEQRASLGEAASNKYPWINLIIGLVMSVAFLFWSSKTASDFDPSRLPVAACNFMKANTMTKGLCFTKDNWGAYLYWKLGKPIFLDDKTDFYSQNILDDYMTVFMSKPGWQDVLTKYKFKYVLIPKGLPLQFDLENMHDWKRAYQDETCVLFEKN